MAGQQATCPQCTQPVLIPVQNTTVVAEVPSQAPAARFDYFEVHPQPALASYKEPHRGVAVLVIGILSLFTLPLILGPIAWCMGRRDLRKMRTGLMDADGMGMTSGGHICGMVATLVYGAVGCCVLAVYLSLFGGLGMLYYHAAIKEEQLTVDQAAKANAQKVTPDQPAKAKGPKDARRIRTIARTPVSNRWKKSWSMCARRKRLWSKNWSH
jgi:hypothetical protein